MKYYTPNCLKLLDSDELTPQLLERINIRKASTLLTKETSLSTELISGKISTTAFRNFTDLITQSIFSKSVWRFICTVRAHHYKRRARYLAHVAAKPEYSTLLRDLPDSGQERYEQWLHTYQNNDPDMKEIVIKSCS